MSYADFQADWEQTAAAEYERYLGMPSAALIGDPARAAATERHRLIESIVLQSDIASGGPPMSEHVTVELLKGCPDVFNRNDLDSIMSYFADDGDFGVSAWTLTVGPAA